MRLLPWQLNNEKQVLHYRTLRAGFTIVELVISLSIIILISVQVLASFSSLNQASVLKRAAQELSFNIRRAQNMALAVAPVSIGPGGAGCFPRSSPCIPQAVGIRLTTSSSDTDIDLNGTTDGIPDNEEYFFFTDQDNNGAYDAVNQRERIEPSITLPRGIRITSITGTTPPLHPDGHIIFYAPEARVAMTDYKGISVGNVMDVTLTSSQGGTIKIRVLLSGQVSVL